jgi:hypothetical protein
MVRCGSGPRRVCAPCPDVVQSIVSGEVIKFVAGVSGGRCSARIEPAAALPLTP